MQTCRINFRQIDFSDDTFRLDPRKEDVIPDDLLLSIERIGVLHPPIVKEKRDDCYRIISGRKRFLALAEIGLKSTECLVMGDSVNGLACLGAALEDALAGNTLSPVGRAIFFSKALKETDKKEAAKRFLPILGFPPRPGLIDKFVRLLQLEEPLLSALHKGELDEKSAMEMTGFSFDERLVLYEIISLLNLSVSNQRKLIMSCREMARRNNISIRQFLSNGEVEVILNHAGANQPQKATKLMSWINRQRFPRLTAAEQEFRQFCGKLRLPANVSLAHSPSFEKDELTMSIIFADKEELKDKWSALARALDGKQGPLEEKS